MNRIIWFGDKFRTGIEKPAIVFNTSNEIHELLKLFKVITLNRLEIFNFWAFFHSELITILCKKDVKIQFVPEFHFLFIWIGELANRVFKYSLNTLGWTEKIRIVRLLFRDWNRFLPSRMKNSPPENYANQLPELFKTINDIDGQARQYFSQRVNSKPEFF